MATASRWLMIAAVITGFNTSGWAQKTDQTESPKSNMPFGARWAQDTDIGQITRTMNCEVDGDRGARFATGGRLVERQHGVSFPISGPVASAVSRKLVGVAGFEPATPTSRTWCATRLRYTSPSMPRLIQSTFRDGNRTTDKAGNHT
jgi:hypothetical protein